MNKKGKGQENILKMPWDISVTEQKTKMRKNLLFLKIISWYHYEVLAPLETLSIGISLVPTERLHRFYSERHSLFFLQSPGGIEDSKYCRCRHCCRTVQYGFVSETRMVKSEHINISEQVQGKQQAETEIENQSERDTF